MSSSIFPFESNFELLPHLRVRSDNIPLEKFPYLSLDLQENKGWKMFGEV